MAALFIYTAAHSIWFLKRYRTLQQKGLRAVGTISSVTLSGKFFIRNASVPKIIFYTEDNQKVAGTPRHSLFIELSFYRQGQEHLIFYKRHQPDHFVISNPGEVFAAVAMICLSLGCLGWFLATQLVPVL